jgi:hypothetical protein
VKEIFNILNDFVEKLYPELNIEEILEEVNKGKKGK